MPHTHVPVLAGELIEALDPRPGQIAVDCTLGAAGHARLVAERLGPTGTLIAIDRDPLAEKAFAELAADLPCDDPLHPRRLRARPARSWPRRASRADLVYIDLGMSSMQVDTRERGFSYAYDAPLDMRMDPDQELTAAEIVNTWDRRRSRACCASTARSATPTGSPARSSAAAPLDHDVRARRRDHRRDPGARAVRRRPPGQAHLPGDPDRRQRRARPARRGAAARVGRPRRRRASGRASRSTRSRTAASSASSPSKARGCICPPDLPICVCGRTPEAELVFRRSVAPTPGEVADNPRSKSARLRAARKLREEP